MNPALPRRSLSRLAGICAALLPLNRLRRPGRWRRFCTARPADA